MSAKGLLVYLICRVFRYLRMDRLLLAATAAAGAATGATAAATAAAGRLAEQRKCGEGQPVSRKFGVSWYGRDFQQVPAGAETGGVQSLPSKI